ncbi:MAG: anti-sigma factor family protein [Pyrinomonadaceae bacterium]
MNGNCLDIGTIQAFLDGETSQEVSLSVSAHIAHCDDCTNLLAVAEDENAFVFSALDRDMNTLVPTQRLWSRINESIEVEKTKEPIWKQVFAFISASLASPSLTAAAGVLIVFGFVAAMWALRSNAPTPVDNNVVAIAPQSSGSVAINATLPVAAPDASIDTSSNDSSATGVQQIEVSHHSPKKLEEIVREANKRNEIRPITLDYNVPLPGEQGYIKTIADLKQTVDGRKDAVFSGSSRVAFERDLAVVNDGIKRMQKVVRKNPNSQSARQVLYSAYQDKIDLLNSVAQREELMAITR